MAISIIGFIDSSVVRLLEKHKESTFGQQRFYAPISLAVASALAGIASDHYNHSELSSYTAVFYVFLPYGLFLIISLSTIKQIDSGQNEGKGPIERNRIIKPFLRTCSDRSVLFFLMTILLMGINNGLINGFTMIFLESINASKTVMGLSVATSALSEVIMYQFSSHVITFFKGTYQCLTISVLSYSIRFLSLSYLEEPWLALPIQMLQSFGFALFWTVTVNHTKEISPKEIHTTMFTTVNCIYFSL